MKAMHRLILNSATYRQDSKALNSKAAEIDPENHLLWRFNRQRLEGESVRDAVLMVSGRLNPEHGGLPVYPAMPAGVAEVRVQGVDTWETSPEADGNRRSIYVFQRRAQGLPLMETFDAPVPNASCERRRHSVSSLQALSMYGGEFVNTEAKHLAARIVKETGPDVREQVGRAFLIAFGRQPSTTELQDALAFLKTDPHKEESLVGLCRVLLNANEFLYVD